MKEVEDMTIEEFFDVAWFEKEYEKEHVDPAHQRHWYARQIREHQRNLYLSKLANQICT